SLGYEPFGVAEIAQAEAQPARHPCAQGCLHRAHYSRAGRLQLLIVHTRCECSVRYRAALRLEPPPAVRGRITSGTRHTGTNIAGRVVCGEAWLCSLLRY